MVSLERVFLELQRQVFWRHPGRHCDWVYLFHTPWPGELAAKEADVDRERSLSGNAPDGVVCIQASSPEGRGCTSVVQDQLHGRNSCLSMQSCRWGGPVCW